MKRAALLALALASVFIGEGCKKPASSAASINVEKAFDNAPAAVKDAAQGLNAELKSGDYQGTLNSLAKVTSARNLDQHQRDALASVVAQLNELAATNPAFNTRENTRLRQKIMADLNGR